MVFHHRDQKRVGYYCAQWLKHAKGIAREKYLLQKCQKKLVHRKMAVSFGTWLTRSRESIQQRKQIHVVLKRLQSIHLTKAYRTWVERTVDRRYARRVILMLLNKHSIWQKKNRSRSFYKWRLMSKEIEQYTEKINHKYKTLYYVVQHASRRIEMAAKKGAVHQWHWQVTEEQLDERNNRKAFLCWLHASLSHRFWTWYDQVQSRKNQHMKVSLHLKKWTATSESAALTAWRVKVEDRQYVRHVLAQRMSRIRQLYLSRGWRRWRTSTAQQKFAFIQIDFGMRLLVKLHQRKMKQKKKQVLQALSAAAVEHKRTQKIAFQLQTKARRQVLSHTFTTWHGLQARALFLATLSKKALQKRKTATLLHSFHQWQDHVVTREQQRNIVQTWLSTFRTSERRKMLRAFSRWVTVTEHHSGMIRYIVDYTREVKKKILLRMILIKLHIYIRSLCSQALRRWMTYSHSTFVAQTRVQTGVRKMCACFFFLNNRLLARAWQRWLSSCRTKQHVEHTLLIVQQERLQHLLKTSYYTWKKNVAQQVTQRERTKRMYTRRLHATHSRVVQQWKRFTEHQAHVKTVLFNISTRYLVQQKYNQVVACKTGFHKFIYNVYFSRVRELAAKEKEQRKETRARVLFRINAKHTKQVLKTGFQHWLNSVQQVSSTVHQFQQATMKWTHNVYQTVFQTWRRSLQRHKKILRVLSSTTVARQKRTVRHCWTAWRTATSSFLLGRKHVARYLVRKCQAWQMQQLRDAWLTWQLKVSRAIKQEQHYRLGLRLVERVLRRHVRSAQQQCVARWRKNSAILSRLHQKHLRLARLMHSYTLKWTQSTKMQCYKQWYQVVSQRRAQKKLLARTLIQFTSRRLHQSWNTWTSVTNRRQSARALLHSLGIKHHHYLRRQKQRVFSLLQQKTKEMAFYSLQTGQKNDLFTFRRQLFHRLLLRKRKKWLQQGFVQMCQCHREQVQLGHKMKRYMHRMQQATLVLPSWNRWCVVVQEQQRLRVASRRVVQRLRGNLLSVRASLFFYRLILLLLLLLVVLVPCMALYGIGNRTHIKASYVLF